MLETLRRTIGRVLPTPRLSSLSIAERERDRSGRPAGDPGIEAVVDAGLAWLARAQDHSTSADGGVARSFGFETGWAPSYPETTGYIVPTVLACAASRGDAALKERGKRMLDWLLRIQLPGGGYQGGVITARPVTPVTFNTGQILLGLSAGCQHFGERYAPALHAAAEWLTASQDADGGWRKHPTPFAAAGEKAYETHVAWGLLEASRASSTGLYAEAALRNIHWALGKQQRNGWFADNCLNDPAHPLTHTIGYVLRGIVEGYLHTRDRRLLEASRRTADGILSALRSDGHLPGRLSADWSGAASWSCLTGTVQIAHCWLLLFRETGDERYREAAFAANQYVRRAIRTTGPDDLRGGVKGSFPVDGAYGRFEMLSWGCKFSIDSNLLEQSVRGSNEARPEGSARGAAPPRD